MYWIHTMLSHINETFKRRLKNVKYRVLDDDAVIVRDCSISLMNVT